MTTVQFEFEAIGTWWVIDAQISDTFSSALVLQKIQDRIEAFDCTYSRFRADSFVSNLSQEPGVYTLPSDAKPLFDLYQKLYDITHGSFTPLIGQTLHEAGYDASYSLVPKKLNKLLKWEAAIQYRYPKLEVKQQIILDFGAAGKGYLIDIVGELLSTMKAHTFCVDAGGDMLYHNSENKPLRVGLEHPDDTQKIIGIATITGQAICGSAGNRRKWANFHHIINPHTLSSPDHIRAVWVIADTAMLADALSTCLFFIPPKQLLQHYTFEYLILNSDYSVTKSDDFPAELFYNKN